MLKRLFASAFVTFAIATSGSALHPFGQVRKEKSRSSLLEGGEIDGATLGILERAARTATPSGPIGRGTATLRRRRGWLRGTSAKPERI
jgi:hypothetical protein